MDDILTKLHDAAVESITYRWQERQVDIIASVFDSGTNQAAQPFCISFHNVTRLAIPHVQPWGPSVFINAASNKTGIFQIEMQSGDVLEITAENVTADPDNKQL